MRPSSYSSSCLILLLLLPFAPSASALFPPSIPLGSPAPTSSPLLPPLSYSLTSSTPWLVHSEAEPSSLFTFILALPHSPSTLITMEERLWAVSDPLSEDYGRFLSVEDIHRSFAVTEQVKQTLMEWMGGEGVRGGEVTDWGDTLKVRTTVEVAERLLGVRLHRFLSVGGADMGHSILRSINATVSLPPHIRSLVSLVLGVTFTSTRSYASSPVPPPHPLRRSIRSTARSPTDPPVPVVVPATIASTYGLPCHNFTDCLPFSSPSAAVGLIEFQAQCFSPADLVRYGLEMGLGNVSTVAPAHLSQPANFSSSEGQLDISMVVAVAPAAELWYLYYHDYLYEFVDDFLNASHPVPAIVSISYAGLENEACDDNIQDCQDAGANSTRQYLERMNVEFMKLGLRGVSVLTASGDGGASDKWYNCHRPGVDQPAASAYVTSVGATELRDAVFQLQNPPPVCSNSNWSCVSGGTEAAVSNELADYPSGGGFSSYTSQPPYQRKVVSAYLDSGVPLPPPSLFNRSGRGVPDVSALGWNALYTCSDEFCEGDYKDWFIEGGTSMSAPIFAGVVSLLLSRFHNLTGHSFGLLNPLLYLMSSDDPSTFHDIVLGDNKFNSSCEGYYTAKGWDPVTGLGTPNFPQMLKYVTHLGETLRARRVNGEEHAETQESEWEAVSE